jgi:hypothetical protein
MSYVDNFLSHYANHKDFSKASRFDVDIFLPDSLVNVLPNPSGLKFQCEIAELPGYNFDTIDGRIYGAPYAIAARPSFQDLRLTFICAGDLWEKKFFDAWQEFIMPKTDFLPRYRIEYVANIEVRQYYSTGEISYLATFREAFPSSIDPIALSWGDDAINRLSVTFKYRYWNVPTIKVDRRA